MIIIIISNSNACGAMKWYQIIQNQSILSTETYLCLVFRLTK